jgi:lactobin A/cerein 7B family class IIb bacteriocin
MLATDRDVLRLGILMPGKGRGKRKQNKQMEKFKELSIEEMQEVEGGMPHFGVLVSLAMAAGAAGYAAASWAFEKGEELGKSLAKN